MATDYEAEYNNRRRVPEAADISGHWKAVSDAYRRSAVAELDEAYGPRERQRYDIFYSGDEQAPLVMYIHGGYWQWGDRTLYSFIAKALNANGMDVALPSYSLCPAVSVADIVDEMRLCLQAIWRKTSKHPLVVGHSAGGHLTAAMLATDWSRAPDVPIDLVHTGISISGIFDLEPLVNTSMNDALRLDSMSARSVSPRFWPPPPLQRTLIAVVGERESSEFRRQSKDIVDHWASAGVRTEYVEKANANHFTVLEGLQASTDPLTERILHLAKNS
jgi:arylformamidase